MRLNILNMKYTSITTLIVFSLLAITADSVRASERRFAFSYETTTLPKGSLEFEPWFTYKHYSDKDRFEFRYELEYGVTDAFQLAAYLSDWSLTDQDKGGTDTEWQSAGLEAVYALSDPNKDALGSALYGEVLLGPESFALEGKILLQKNFGPLALVYNGVVEAEWEGHDYEEKVGVWENTLGLSYQFSPGFSAGVEAVHEIEFADWSDAGEHVVSVGPNVSLRSKGCYATLAALFQATDVEGEPDAELRLLLGFSF
jgi:hypothetical protein